MVIKKLEGMREAIAREIADVAVGNYDRYRELVGERRGLLHAIHVVRESKTAEEE